MLVEMGRNWGKEGHNTERVASFPRSGCQHLEADSGANGVCLETCDGQLEERRHPEHT